MRKFLAICLVGCLVLGTAGAAMAALGAHGLAGTEGECANCHNRSQTAKLRGWGILGEPTGGNAWYGRPIAKLCWTCHKSPNAYTATDMDGFAFADGSHQFDEASAPYTTDAWTAGSRETFAGALSLPYVTDGVDLIDCTSCHNVHADTYRPFSMKGPGAGDFSTLCTTCHLNRANATGFGATNSVNNVSTHPTDVVIDDNGGNGVASFLADCDARLARVTAAAWKLGGHLKNPTQDATGVATKPFTCGTCHMVHGDWDTSITGNNALLTINSLYQPNSPLCTGCHDGVVGAAGTTNHPLNGAIGWTFYPDEWADATYGIPLTWQSSVIGGSRVVDSNAATTFDPTFGGLPAGVPACSSCHDAHGGINQKSLFYGPDEGSGTLPNGWCFSCHTVAGVLPDYHHSVVENWGSSQLGCGDCHGPRGGTADNDGLWTAHNGFAAFRTAALPLSLTDSAFCELCHEPLNPTAFVAGSDDGTVAYAGWLNDTTVLGGDAGGLPLFPAHHGPDTTAGTDSHAVNTNLGLDNLLAFTGNWAALANPPYDKGGDGVLSQWGAGSIIRCESCHNILENVGLQTGDLLGGGWKANLLLGIYEDDDALTGAGEAPDYLPNVGLGAVTGDQFCRVCHNYDAPPGDGTGDGAGSYVHYPAAHTVESDTFTYSGWGGTLPYDHAGATPTDGILTDLILTCPDATTADAAAAPGGFSYPVVNRLDCDSCHKPHNAFTGDSTTALNTPTITGHAIVQVDAATMKTTVCAQCHNEQIQCGFGK